MDPKSIEVCTVHYNGLYCDGPCAECDEVAADRAFDRAETGRRDEPEFWPEMRKWS
jgi:hypothetical protein